MIHLFVRIYLYTVYMCVHIFIQQPQKEGTVGNLRICSKYIIYNNLEALFNLFGSCSIHKHTHTYIYIYILNAFACAHVGVYAYYTYI